MCVVIVNWHSCVYVSFFKLLSIGMVVVRVNYTHLLGWWWLITLASSWLKFIIFALLSLIVNWSVNFFRKKFKKFCVFSPISSSLIFTKLSQNLVTTNSNRTPYHILPLPPLYKPPLHLLRLPLPHPLPLN